MDESAEIAMVNTVEVDGEEAMVFMVGILLEYLRSHGPIAVNYDKVVETVDVHGLDAINVLMGQDRTLMVSFKPQPKEGA